MTGLQSLGEPEAFAYSLQLEGWLVATAYVIREHGGQRQFFACGGSSGTLAAGQTEAIS